MKLGDAAGHYNQLKYGLGINTFESSADIEETLELSRLSKDTFWLSISCRVGRDSEGATLPTAWPM